MKMKKPTPDSPLTSDSLWLGLVAVAVGCLLVAGDNCGWLPGLGSAGRGAVIAGLAVMGLRGVKFGLQSFGKT